MTKITVIASKINVVKIIILLASMFIFANHGFGNEINGNYALVSYTNPKKEFYIPFNVQQVLQLSDHKFFVGNEGILKEIKENIEKIKNKRNFKKSGYPGYFFSLTLYDNSIVQYNLYIQRDRSFLLETHKRDINGVMNEENFNKFILLCERMTNIIDYNYQWKRLK